MSDGQFDGEPRPGAAGAITGRSHEPGYGALDRTLRTPLLAPALGSRSRGELA